MFLDSILLIETHPCLADPGRLVVIGKPARSLNEIIPYLAALPGVIAYNPELSTLTFRRPRGFMTMYPDRVCITQVKDVSEGLDLLQALVEAVNATWSHRAEITPVHATRQHPTPMAIYKLLPNINCKQCGEPTCYTFALKLAAAQKKLEKCVPLVEPQYAERLTMLELILFDTPAIG